MVGALLLACVLVSACSADCRGALSERASVAIGTNARTEQVDAHGFAIVVDGKGHGRVVGTLLNTELSPHAMTAASIKSEATPVRTAVLADIIRLPPRAPVDLLDAPIVSVPARDLSAGSFVELTLDITDGELVDMLVPVEAQKGPYADVDVVAPTAARHGVPLSMTGPRGTPAGQSARWVGRELLGRAGPVVANRLVSIRRRAR
ncbi:hypothetical protein ASC64_09405 [Nocardioides sp. Root122]|nr:hypothetical protein ASC64_09405 [Nocardioides sp. Root122]